MHSKLTYRPYDHEQLEHVVRRMNTFLTESASSNSLQNYCAAVWALREGVDERASLLQVRSYNQAIANEIQRLYPNLLQVVEPRSRPLSRFHPFMVMIGLVPKPQGPFFAPIANLKKYATLDATTEDTSHQFIVMPPMQDRTHAIFTRLTPLVSKP